MPPHGGFRPHRPKGNYAAFARKTIAKGIGAYGIEVAVGPPSFGAIVGRIREGSWDWT
jgi:hypothetical protein